MRKSSYAQTEDLNSCDYVDQSIRGNLATTEYGFNTVWIFLSVLFKAQLVIQWENLVFF